MFDLSQYGMNNYNRVGGVSNTDIARTPPPKIQSSVYKEEVDKDNPNPEIVKASFSSYQKPTYRQLIDKQKRGLRLTTEEQELLNEYLENMMKGGTAGTNYMY